MYIYIYIHVYVPCPFNAHKTRRVALKTEGFKQQISQPLSVKALPKRKPQTNTYHILTQFQGVPFHVLKHGFTQVAHRLLTGSQYPVLVKKRIQGFHKKTQCT